jgi:hypothetical protein
VINLILALVWGVLGVALIYYNATTGDPRGRIPMLGNISLGWAAELLCLYNLARWWSQRLVLAEKNKAEWVARARRDRDLRVGQRPEYGEPNPDFIFDDEPPAPKT